MIATRQTPPSRSTWFLGLALVVAACAGQSGRAAQEALDAATAKWLAVGPTSYTIAYERRCLCANSGEFVAEVRGGAVVTVEPEVGIGGEAELPFALTVPEMFATVQAAIDRDAAVVAVEYDEELGYPIRVTIDGDRSAEDDELVLTAEVSSTDRVSP